ncbi:MAG: phytanoyl-CoA dioxygenase family protein [Spirochaetaceae bacterium]|nr:phytanoyl-CoA dioxygenase family protein [Spirochaetaceae bacterium]
MEKVLTDAQVQQFRADGLLLIPGLIPESVYGPVREDLGRLIDAARDGPAPDHTYMYYTDPRPGDRPWLYRINELIGTHRLDSVKLMLAYPPLLTAVCQVVGREHFAASAAAVVFKLPNSVVPVGWHQDGVAVNRWPVFDTDIYLDDSDPDNGGLWGIPGSHLAGYNPELRNELIASYTGGREAGDVPGAVPVIARPGDVNLHANSVVHGSFASRTPRLRRALYFHWDNYADIALRSEDDQWRRLYLWAQQSVCDAIALRASRFPNETPFPYQTVAPEALPGSSPEWFSPTQTTRNDSATD